MSAVILTAVAAVTAGVGALGSLGIGISGKVKANKNAQIEARKEKRMQQKLEALERSRQQVVDKSDEIRAMKDEVFNPYQNLGVAMQGVNLKMEETDEALANTLNALNKSGAGAGAATALARQAAASKAQVAASIENQELKNQQLYLAGEQQKVGQQLKLEQQALQEEINVYSRQETRDIAQLNRLASQQQNAAQRQMQFMAGGDAALASGVAGFTQGAASIAGMDFSGFGGAPSTPAANTPQSTSVFNSGRGITSGTSANATPTGGGSIVPVNPSTSIFNSGSLTYP